MNYLRYEVTDETGHPCCHSASVIDTGTITDRRSNGEPIYDTVCECYDRKTAELIAAALNRETVQ